MNLEPNILGHNQPTSETPFQWNFTGGLNLPHYYVLTGLSYLLCLNMVFSSFNNVSNF